MTLVKELNAILTSSLPALTADGLLLLDISWGLQWNSNYAGGNYGGRGSGPNGVQLLQEIRIEQRIWIQQ